MPKNNKTKKPKKESPVRNKILSKARSLFGRKGYQNTTVRDIATAYGCEPANIYNFFQSKEDVLFEILRQEIEAITSSLVHLKNDETTDPAAQLKIIFECHGKVTLGKMRTSKVLFDSGLGNLTKKHQRMIIEKRDEYDAILRLVIQRGIDAGIFETTDVKMASFAIASLIARTRVWYKSSGPMSMDEIIESLYRFALRGLGYKAAQE